MLIRPLTASLLSLAVVSLPAATQTAKAAALLALCKADAERICPGVAPGGGKIIACLKLHKDDVSIGCAKALKALKAKKGNATLHSDRATSAFQSEGYCANAMMRGLPCPLQRLQTTRATESLPNAR